MIDINLVITLAKASKLDFFGIVEVVFGLCTNQEKKASIKMKKARGY